jgi:hypothetical protein
MLIPNPNVLVVIITYSLPFSSSPLAPTPSLYIYLLNYYTLLSLLLKIHYNVLISTLIL